MPRQSDCKIFALLPLMSANGKLAMTIIGPIIVVMAISLSIVRTGTGLAMQAGSNLGEPAANIAKRKVLYLTHSAGFKHEVLPLSEQIFKQIGERSGAFEVIATQDCSLLSRDGLKPYDAMVFYTTGEL